MLFILYMLVLLRFTIFRESWSLDKFMRNGTLNLSLFTGYLPFVRSRNWWRIIYLFGGNIVCFIPFGVYLHYRGFHLLPATICGFLLSFFIESMQYVWGVGVSELDDLILNTLGVFIGAVSAGIFAKKRKK